MDPDTGEFSEEAISSVDEAAFKASFGERRDLILHLLGKSYISPRFPLIVTVENGKVCGSLERLHRVIQWFGIPYGARAVGENRWKKRWARRCPAHDLPNGPGTFPPGDCL